VKAGTIIKMADGRMATVVYNSLVGVGIKWGEHHLSQDDLDAILAGNGNTITPGCPEGYEWEPDALLRDPKLTELLGMPCVGEDYETQSVPK